MQRPRASLSGLGTVALLGVIGLVAVLQGEAILLRTVSELDHFAERLIETAAAVALVGMLVALVTASRTPASARKATEDSNPLASTNSNGTV